MHMLHGGVHTMHAYYACEHASMQTCKHASMQACMQACMHIMHIMHACMHAYHAPLLCMHAYYDYIHACILCMSRSNARGGLHMGSDVVLNFLRTSLRAYSGVCRMSFHIALQLSCRPSIFTLFDANATKSALLGPTGNLWPMILRQFLHDAILMWFLLGLGFLEISLDLLLSSTMRSGLRTRSPRHPSLRKSVCRLCLAEQRHNSGSSWLSDMRIPTNTLTNETLQQELESCAWAKTVTDANNMTLGIHSSSHK